MDRDPGRAILADVMKGAKAPSASQPGMGTGNVPYAKGMMSGQFGAPAQPPQAPATPPPPPGPASAPDQGGGAPPAAAGAPPPSGNPFLQPTFYFEVMGSIMQALVSAAENTEGPY